MVAKGIIILTQLAYLPKCKIKNTLPSDKFTNMFFKMQSKCH